jgi:hypothetical protein
LGSKYCANVTDNDRLFSHFNAEFEQTLIVMADEIASQGSMHKRADMFKTIVTRDVIVIERKGRERIEMPDYNDYILFSNNDWVVRLGTTDRRYLCLDLLSDTELITNRAYWDNVYTHMNDECGLHMFHYLANYNISRVQLKDIPDTQWKRQLKELTLDPMVKSLINFVNNRLTNVAAMESKRFPVVDFFNEFLHVQHRSINEPQTNCRAFSVNMHRLLNLPPCKQCRVNGVVARCVDISITQLQEKIRTILRDPHYVFESPDVDYNQPIADDD